jgi:hypothetical protein
MRTTSNTSCSSAWSASRAVVDGDHRVPAPLEETDRDALVHHVVFDEENAPPVRRASRAGRFRG